MAVSPQTTRVRRVLFALVIAVVFIFGAYLISNPNTFAPSTANAESTQALLEAYAQKKGPDGLPLWEEQLIATASSTAWANTASSSDDTLLAPAPDAAAGSLTDQFAQNLFTQYMQQRGDTEPSDSDIDTFAASSIQNLVQSHAQQNVYTVLDVKSGGTGNDALLMYAAAADKAIAAHTTDTSETELDYFDDAVEKNDTGELKQVAEIGAAYTGLAPALMQIEVPTEAQQAHLEIANAMARLGNDITDMSMMETDPLRAYLGLSAYQTDADSLQQGFSDMGNVFAQDQVTIGPNELGYGFYSVIQIATPQASSTAQ
jgi:hypothetical protein